MSVIDSSTDARTLSYAHQAVAIALRDRGQVDRAIAHGFNALRYARRVDKERQGDVLATLGPVLIYAGKTREGLRRLQEALPLTPSTKLPRLFLRRAHSFALLARYEEALADLDLSITGSHHLRDVLWEGRALNNRCDVLLALGRPDEVEADSVRAEQLLASIGQEFEATQSVQNRALAAHERGDIPTALELLDQAIARYRRLGNIPNDLAYDHMQTLLTAGLSQEAFSLGDRTLAQTDLAPVRRAEVLFVTAKAALGAGDAHTAERLAREAARLFAAQLRPAWVGRARLLRLRAQFLSQHPELVPWMVPEGEFTGVQPRTAPAQTRRLLREAAHLVRFLRESGSPELPVALLLHGRLARDAGLDGEAEESLLAAADSRRSGPPLSRAAGWLAAAHLAEHRRDRRALYLACRRGLDAVDEYRSVLGDLELRALASGHGLEFFQLSVRQAVRSNRPRELLWWAERWRAAALNGPRTRPQDPELRRALASLRDVTRRLDAVDDDQRRAALTREKARHENTIRRALHHQRGEGSGAARGAGLDLDAVLAELGDDGALVTTVRVGTELHLLVVARHRVQHKVVGEFASATREAEFARLALRRAAYGRVVDLENTGSMLQTALLGPGFALPSGTRYAVVVPPAHLLTAPWGMLPAFRDAVLVVSPSVSQWIRARRQPDEGRRHVALVTGPNLTTREAEVSSLSRLHQRAKVLSSAEATASAALEVIEGARLAHIAAHGVFRGDAPLFSALLLADGPLTVHDLRQLERPPTSFVLSACDSGGAAPIGPFEALGLVASLLGMGTASVLASVVPVNDQACLSVMADVHRVAGRDEGTVAEGWLAARRAAAGDDLASATAASFTAWGA
jgi:tetratricopeptide (TPR) repeat protein